MTDIGLMYDIGWSDFMGDKWMRYGMPRMIGDPAKDAAQLRATSPLAQAARIKQPVMMAYGVEDRRVPLPHGTKMRDALKAASTIPMSNGSPTRAKAMAGCWSKTTSISGPAWKTSSPRT